MLRTTRKELQSSRRNSIAARRRPNVEGAPMRKIDVFPISRRLVVGTFPVCHPLRLMPTPRCKFTPLRSSIWRCARLALLCLLALAAGFLRAGRASAQSACAQLGVDCNLPAPPPVSAPVATRNRCHGSRVAIRLPPAAVQHSTHQHSTHPRSAEQRDPPE